MSSVGGSPGRCFLNTSTSAASSRVVGSFSSVMRMKGELSEERQQILSFGLVEDEAGALSSAGSARSSVVIGSLRLRSMRT